MIKRKIVSDFLFGSLFGMTPFPLKKKQMNLYSSTQRILIYDERDTNPKFLSSVEIVIHGGRNPHVAQKR